MFRELSIEQTTKCDHLIIVTLLGALSWVSRDNTRIVTACVHASLARYASINQTLVPAFEEMALGDFYPSDRLYNSLGNSPKVPSPQ